MTDPIRPTTDDEPEVSLSDERASSDADPDGQAEPDERRKWWEGDHLPWSSEPDRYDITCWALFGLAGVYAMAMNPLTPILLEKGPYWLAAAEGSRLAMVDIGSSLAMGESSPWVWGVVLAAISMIKFDLIFWWAGKLWGTGLVEVVAGRREGAVERSKKIQRITGKYAIPMMAVTQLPIPVPDGIVYAAVGMSGMSWKKFLLLDFLFALISRVAYLYLGYRVGEPAVKVIDVMTTYSIYVSVGIVVLMLAGFVINSRKKKSAA